MPLLALVVGQLIDIIVGALTRNPAWEPHLGPLLVKLIPTLSHAVGETAEETASRRATAEAVFSKWANPPVSVFPNA